MSTTPPISDKAEEDEVVVVCMLANGLPHVPNSRMTSCAKCKTDIYLSPSTLLAAQGAAFTPVCVSCFSKDVRNGMEFETAPVHAAQLAEVNKYVAEANPNPTAEPSQVSSEIMNELVKHSLDLIKAGVYPADGKLPVPHLTGEQ